MKAEKKKIVVIGGGASGCMAAIAAAREGSTVYLLEKNEKLGKKLYATGNGRCNLTNLYLDSSCYHADGSPDSDRVLSLLSRFSQSDLIRFFQEIGVPVHDRAGYVYPRTDQAETVVKALEKCIRSLGIRVLTQCNVKKVEPSGSAVFKKTGGDDLEVPVSTGGEKRRFLVFCETGTESGTGGKSARKGTSEKKAKPWAREKNRGEASSGTVIACDCVIVCTGGLAGPDYGCSGDGYHFAERFSHHLNKPLPALTQLICGNPWQKRAAGVRCHASVCLLDSRGKMIRGTLEDGELQMTQFGLSGIPVMQLSGQAARILEAGSKTFARIDFLPEFSGRDYLNEQNRRLQESRDQTLSDLLLGLVHRKIIDFVLASEGLQAEMKARRFSDRELQRVFDKLRGFTLEVTAVRSFEYAQVTAGGIPLSEVSDTLESIFCPGLFLAGEILDVDGRCGGYNLQWAMTGGMLAGRASSQH